MTAGLNIQVDTWQTSGDTDDAEESSSTVLERGEIQITWPLNSSFGLFLLGAIIQLGKKNDSRT